MIHLYSVTQAVEQCEEFRSITKKNAYNVLKGFDFLQSHGFEPS
jgi:hypothetical protein